ncbi:MAG: DUF1707 SHOCT-like domain-containing protein [Acidimicrobiales bacterium]
MNRARRPEARQKGAPSWRREEVFRRPRVACSEGRLTLGELAARTRTAHEARSGLELGAVVADLPRPVGALPDRLLGRLPGHGRGRGRSRGRPRRVLVSVLYPVGFYVPVRRLGRRTLALALVGEVLLDLRQAVITSFESEIMAVSVLGEVRVIVPPGARLEAEGAVSVAGATVLPASACSPSPAGATDAMWTPVVRVRGVAVLGDVRVEVRGYGQ